MKNTTTNTATTKAIDKANMVQAGKKMQESKAELSQFEKDLEFATEKLALATTWKLKLSTHYVTLKSGKIRKYISVDSGMPRDISVILVEGKDHNIQVKFISSDSKYSNDKKANTTDQDSYNAMIDKWARVCGKEATNRIETVLKAVKGFDELWAYVVLLERNAEIAKSEKFAEFFN